MFRDHKHFLALGVVIVVAGLLHVGSLRNGFVADDRYIVVRDESAQPESSWIDLFSKPWGAGAGSKFEQRMNQGYYRPLAMGLIRLQNAGFGQNPIGYHGFNILLHVLVCAFVFLIANRWMELPGALVAGIAFAVHAVHTEAVNVVFYQTTLLVALFTLSSLWIYSSPRVGVRRRGVIVGLFVLGLLCKETAILMPLALLIYELFFRRGSWKTLFSPLFLTLAAIGVAYLFFRSAILSGDGFSYFEGIPIWNRFLTMSGVFGLYLKLLIWPFPLCPFYEWSILPPTQGLGSTFVLTGAISVGFYVAVTSFVIRRWHGLRSTTHELLLPYSIAGFCLCFFVATLLPVLHLVPILNVAAERFVYLGSFGFCVLLGYSFQYLGERLKKTHMRIGVPVVLGLYLIMLGFLTVSRNGDWRSDETLSRATLSSFPMSLSARITLTQILVEREEFEEALEHARIGRKYAPSLTPLIELEKTAADGLADKSRDHE